MATENIRLLYKMINETLEKFESFDLKSLEKSMIEGKKLVHQLNTLATDQDVQNLLEILNNLLKCLEEYKKVLNSSAKATNNVNTQLAQYSLRPTTTHLVQGRSVDATAWNIHASEKETLILTSDVSDQTVCFFAAHSMEIIRVPRAHVKYEELKSNTVYLTPKLARDNIGAIKTATAKYTKRNKKNYLNEEEYRQYILQSIIVGSRAQDYQQRVAVVIEIDSEQIVLRITSMIKKRSTNFRLIAESGKDFTVNIEEKEEQEEDNWLVRCKLIKGSPIPPGVGINSKLEIGDNIKQSPVTKALFQWHDNPIVDSNSNTRAQSKKIENWPLLSKIYGKQTYFEPSKPEECGRSFSLKNGGSIELNEEQVGAIALYNSSSVLSFVIEAPPGSGKTVTTAAMAVSYKGTGVQLFLSSANPAVYNMAKVLDTFDYGERRPFHLASSEGEDKMKYDTPFSSTALAKRGEAVESRDLECHTDNDDNTEIPFYDVYFATVDMIIGYSIKTNDSVHKERLKEVKRVVIDEASQLTEAALNIIIHCFPKAQIVLVGDSKQLDPFRYESLKVANSLFAESALDVIREKGNIEVIQLKRVYRAPQSLIDHYNSAFYEGELRSEAAMNDKNPLACFRENKEGKRCIFWKVAGSSYTPIGSTSKVNKEELDILRKIVNTLEKSVQKKDIMIICYYEAQRKEAMKMLKGYQFHTVDSAQGLERRVVIVLTTRSNPPSEPEEKFFTSPKRCNVAVSRHKEALIVIGHECIKEVDCWRRVLSNKCFANV